MRNVSYKRVITNASAAADEITSRTRKKNRLYATTFVVIGFLVVLYIFYALSITTLDGFMVSRNVTIRASGNGVVVNYRIKPGDKVKEGDTLYSYMNVDWLSKAVDPYYETQSELRLAEATMRRDRLRSEYTKQSQTVDSLGRVIERATRDVYLGVATREYSEQLEWDLFVARKEMENTTRLIGIEQREIDRAGSIKGRVSDGFTQIGSYSYTDRVKNKAGFGQSYSYRVAYVDMIIVDVHARHGVMVMRGEPVVTYMPYRNPEMLDMHAKLLVDPSQFSEIEDDMIFNVYAGSDYLGKVRVTYKSTFITDHNVTTQDHYERDFKQQDIVVRAEFLDKGCVYAKYMVDKYPLTLRRYKWDWLNDLMSWEHKRRRDNMSSEERVQIPTNKE